jgi:hypothetical protein
MAKIIYALLLALPEIIELIRKCAERNEGLPLSKQVKADLQVINKAIDKAFEENDAKALNDIFRST